MSTKINDVGLTPGQYSRPYIATNNLTTFIGPESSWLYPDVKNKSTVFLKSLLRTSNRYAMCDIGDFTYYSDFDDPLQFFERNVLYDFGYVKSKLTIGKYCSLAHGCRFIMPDANHAITGPSTYPFPGPWSDRVPIEGVPLPPKGDTLVGNDVWIGYEAVIMPGVTIGDGAVVGARSVVTRDIPAYHIVAGNPARVVRARLGQDEIERLRALAWWDWSPASVFEAMPVLIGGDVEALERFARTHRGEVHDGR